MGHKLNIIPRLYDRTGWHQTRQFNVGEIQTIKVETAGKNKSLNSIPSPFARMHLFETAFEMVHHDLINQTNLAGETYGQLISDCFDVFELIYNWDSHIQEQKPLELDTWDRHIEIKMLQSAKRERHRLLGESLKTFMTAESAFRDFDRCLIIKYDGKVIAGTSPFTGFFTAPDDLRTTGLLKPLSHIAYFSGIVPFESRHPEVRRYIYDFFENNPVLKESQHTKAIRDYLEAQMNSGNIPATPNALLHPVTCENATVEVFNQELKMAKSVGIHFFEPFLVRLNYRLNDACFRLPYTPSGERSYDYLLPLTLSFFEEFEPVDIHSMVSIREEAPGTVKVTLKLSGKEISKKYQTRKIHDTDGKIIDLYEDHQINFNLGIFPFLKVTDQPEGVDFNDYYRVMVTVQDFYQKYRNEDFKLRFGKDKFILEESGKVYLVNRTDRTLLETDKSQVGSIYYSLNTCFDFIQVEFPQLESNAPIKCTIVPIWKEKRLGNNQFSFAVDIGTTSTFIAYTNSQDNNAEPRPFELTEQEVPLALLNKPKEKRPEFRWIDCYEEALNVFPASIAVQTQEFVPSIIKRKEKYEFPVRTVMFQEKAIPPGKKIPLANCNISFVYQKAEVTNRTWDNQEFVTDLKWNIQVNRGFHDSIKALIEELIILIRTKILFNSGDPAHSTICWFSPLSFTSVATREFTGIWNEYSHKFLKSKSGNIFNITESEAPYYYLFKSSTVQNPKAVLTMDIGGGSTDIMAFSESKPVLGTSVHFGANVIWGNGFNEFRNDKSNGIFLALKKEMAERLRSTELKKLNEDYCSEETGFAGSHEIINFWIANEDKTEIQQRLNSGQFRLSYLLHLAALIYHSLKWLKANNLNPPTCVIYSGNGSKYVDLIHEAPFISRIWGYFARKIFSEECGNPQIILPPTNRKEATCFGGLQQRQPTTEIKTDNYLGFEEENVTITTYREIEENKESIFYRLLTSYRQFITWFFDMNTTEELNFRNHFGIELHLESIRTFLLDKARENLDEGYLKRINLVNKEDRISDSLFFYPLVGLIYKMNKLQETEKINGSRQPDYYASYPDGECEFLVNRTVRTRRPDSIYILKFENGVYNEGDLSIINDERVHNMALQVYLKALNPVCTYQVFPEPGQRIKVISPGKIKRETDRFVVLEKIKIEFI